MTDNHTDEVDLELERLQRERDELRAALSGLMPFVEEDFPEGDNLPVTWAYGQAVLKARRALAPKKETT